MKPYYESWKASKHSDVTCTKCHFPPGFKEYVKRKVIASAMVVNYVMGTYSSPWAEIEDSSCLREGCHKKESLEKVQYKKTVFEHKPHFREAREEITLRCTSCHSQIVQGEHIKVTESTCYLCHFAEGKREAVSFTSRTKRSVSISGCPSCHEAPKEVVMIDNKEIVHEDFLKTGINCMECHTSVISGKGDVPLQSCISCHAIPERIERHNDVNFLHTKQVSEHNVECQRCHLDIEHELPSPKRLTTGTCESCHDDYHRGQKTVFKGTMRQLHPSCQNCHKTNQHGRKLAPVNCQPCHRKEILTLVSTWKNDIIKSKSELTSAIKKLEKVKDEDIQSLVKKVKSSTNAFKGFKEEELIHNVKFTNSQILSIYDKLQEAYGQTELNFESKHFKAHELLSESSCFPCHFGVESKQLKYSGKKFIHMPHITEAEMGCSGCHGTSAELEESHGKLAIEPSDCEMCH